MADKKRSSRLWDFLVILAIIYLAVEFGMRWFFPATPAAIERAPVVVTMKDDSMALGATPVVIIRNQTGAALTLPCGDVPLSLDRVEGETRTPLETVDAAQDCTEKTVIEAGDSLDVPLESWKSAHFTQTGTFEVRLNDADSVYTARFTLGEPGFVAKIFRAFITKPLLNALIFIASIIPGHDLGLAIILLTLIVKLVLFIPTQHALEGQKKMQLLQPKFEAVRKQYKDNPTKMNEETMKIWKEHKINPLQSCLPLLVQFPVLIGLFYVVQDGVRLDLSQHLIYPVYQNLSWTFDTHFLGLDLTRPYVWLFPPLLVILQFLQIKLSLVIADKKKAKEVAAKSTPEADTPQEVQQKIMLYVLPLVIGFFSLNYASALSIYWGISTLFAIGQQLLVNREHIRA